MIQIYKKTWKLETVIKKKRPSGAQMGRKKQNVTNLTKNVTKHFEMFQKGQSLNHAYTGAR